MNKKLFILIALLVASFTHLLAQEDGEKPCQEIDNKKAKKLYEQGIDKKNKKEDKSREQRLNLSGSWHKGHSHAYNTSFLS